MKEYLTILNNSLESISFYVYYYQTETFKELIGIRTTFFGNKDLKTVTIPTGSVNITITIRMKMPDGCIAWVSSLKLDHAVSKTYEFVGTKDKPLLFEIDPVNINNTSYIYVKNKSSNKIKGELSFNIGKENIAETSKPIKKENTMYLEIPFNALNINLTIYISNILGIFKKVTSLKFLKVPIEKCFEVTDTNFIEIKCSSLSNIKKL